MERQRIQEKRKHALKDGVAMKIKKDPQGMILKPEIQDDIMDFHMQFAEESDEQLDDTDQDRLHGYSNVDELKTRGARPSSKQRSVIIHFMEKHPAMARGLLKGLDGNQRSRELWRRLTADLNSMDGCRKEWQQWRKFWLDKKQMTKVKASKIQKQLLQRDTSAKAEPELTEWELRLLNLLNDNIHSVNEHKSARETIKSSIPSMSPQPSPESPMSQHLESPTAQRLESPHQHFVPTPMLEPHINGIAFPQSENMLRIEERRLDIDTQCTRELASINKHLANISSTLQTIANYLCQKKT